MVKFDALTKAKTAAENAAAKAGELRGKAALQADGIRIAGMKPNSIAHNLV